MGSFSLGRVAQYARYYYVSNNKYIITLLLQFIGIPLLMGVLTREASAIEAVDVAFYLFSAVVSAIFATKAMRDRGRKIMEVTIPVSNEERMVFMLINSAVVFPLMAIGTGLLALVIGSPFSYDEYSLSGGISEMCREFYFNWPFYLSMQLISSACLLINILARRNLFVAYLGAFIGVIVFFGVSGNIIAEIVMHNPHSFDFLNYIDSDKAEVWAKVVFCSLPACFYALCYLALRKRQMKW